MPRFFLVEGKPGVLVAHPWATTANPRRYAGQKLAHDVSVTEKIVRRYVPTAEVIEERGDHLQKAAAGGELIIHNNCDVGTIAHATARMITEK